MKPQRPYLLRALYEWIVDSDEVPYVLVDANLEGVQVPAEHVQDGQIVLNIGSGATRDLNIEDHGVMCGGRFSGRHFDLYLPMASIRAIYARDTQQGMVFPDEPDQHGAAQPDLPDADHGEDDGKPTLRLV